MRAFSLLVLFLLTAGSASASSMGSGEIPEKRNARRDDDLKQTYEGSIRGVRALMRDLKEEQPAIYRKLQAEYEELDRRQTRADIVLISTYGASAAIGLYGMARAFGTFGEGKPFSFTPFVISLGLGTVGTWSYFFMRPSGQEYLNFTNRHNRLNRRRQLEWDTSFRLLPGGAGAEVALRF